MLRTSQSQFDERARMIKLQKVLLEELGPESAASIEFQYSLIRFEAIHETSRAVDSALQIADEVRT